MKTVLVVDDVAHFIDLFRGILQRDYRVKVASSGERALAIARSSPPPDAIILDLLMPEMTGRELLTLLLKDDRTRHIPVIVCSAAADSDALGGELEAACFALLPKPVPAGELLEVMAAATGRSKAG